MGEASVPKWWWGGGGPREAQTLYLQAYGVLAIATHTPYDDLTRYYAWATQLRIRNPIQ